MFWGCFLYDKKGPCYIWDNKTIPEKAESKKWLKEKNELLEPTCQEEWEIATAIRRLNVQRNTRGPKPQ